MNRAQRRMKNKKRSNRDHSIGLTMAKARWAHDAAHDAAHELERERERQRDMWIACVACNAAFHIGEKRMRIFMQALLDASQEWREMKESADEEYADEKLRMKCEKICGAEIRYLFADEAEGG